ncbi:hypothetical protein V6Z05_19560 [Leptospira venezuelensis]|uniref:hypothetical protein n=1 Tax=Leptospira venezuelensis TaxID=1958811 RepID=UPI000A3C4791|nr:hypothetical protein [Leptospira venezuelensis]
MQTTRRALFTLSICGFSLSLFGYVSLFLEPTFSGTDFLILLFLGSFVSWSIVVTTYHLKYKDDTNYHNALDILLSNCPLWIKELANCLTVYAGINIVMVFANIEMFKILITPKDKVIYCMLTVVNFLASCFHYSELKLRE